MFEAATVLLSLLILGASPTHGEEVSTCVENDQFTIPIVDMSLYNHEFEKLSETVIQGLKTSGFLSVINVQDLDTHGLYQMSKWFFNLAPWHKIKLMKHKWNEANSNHYRGYFPIIPNDPSYKEAIEFGRNVSHICDNCKYPPSMLGENSVYFNQSDESLFDEMQNVIKFNTLLDQQYEVLLNVSSLLMKLIAYGLMNDDKVDANNELLNIKDINHFESMFLPYTLSTFRLIHSPPHHGFNDINDMDTQNTQIKQHLSAPEHTDGGFLTLVITYQEGLQVQDYKTLKWYDIDATSNIENGKNGFVVNIGETLSKMTNRYLKATRHRVENKNEDRYSIPFFFEPQYHAKIVNFTGLNDYQFVEYGQFLTEFDKQFIEYSDKPVGMCFHYNNVYDCQTTTQGWINQSNY